MTPTIDHEVASHNRLMISSFYREQSREAPVPCEAVLRQCSAVAPTLYGWRAAGLLHPASGRLRPSHAPLSPAARAFVLQ